KASETFASGIRAGAPAVNNSVTNMASGVRRKLPSSDAKEGPLSTLTQSGRAFVSTFSSGIDNESRRNIPARRFVDLQAKTINEKSPVIQKITNAQNRSFNAKSLVGNLNVSLDGKRISIQELASLLAQLLDNEIAQEGV
ncbi:MAG TPA: hypothetical protein PKK43_11015, partial [Spirochaetota bacterium]|nr:hypothetical protein [Spirochaetota bacterium]